MASGAFFCADCLRRMQAQAKAAYHEVEDPSAFERANYMKMLHSYNQPWESV